MVIESYICELCLDIFLTRREAEEHEKIPIQGIVLPVGLIYRYDTSGKREYDIKMYGLDTPNIIFGAGNILNRDHEPVYNQGGIHKDFMGQISCSSSFSGHPTRVDVKRITEISNWEFHQIKKGLKDYYTKGYDAFRGKVNFQRLAHTEMSFEEFYGLLTNKIPKEESKPENLECEKGKLILLS